jgi:hypothetical protein
MTIGHERAKFGSNLGDPNAGFGRFWGAGFSNVVLPGSLA